MLFLKIVHEKLLLALDILALDILGYIAIAFLDSI